MMQKTIEKNRKSFFSKSCLLLGLFLWMVGVASGRDYKITDFGARGDGTMLCTSTIQHAIDMVSQQGGGRIIFPKGTYLTGSIYMKDLVELHLQKGAVLLGSTNIFDYIKDPTTHWHALIHGVGVEHIAVTGKGVIDGQGFKVANSMVDYIHKGLVKDPLKYDRPNETNRPGNIYFRDCKDVKVQGVLLKDPGCWCQVYDRCEQLLIEGVKVDACCYWNNDGLDIVDCKSVRVEHCFINSSDDAICLKSHSRDHCCDSIIIAHCTARSSANGIKFGTMSLGGFRNVVIHDIYVYDTYRSAITLASVDGGFVENISISDITATNVGNGIFLRIGNRRGDLSRAKMERVSISRFYCTIAADKPDKGYQYEGPIEDLPRNISPAIIVVGLPERPIGEVVLKDIHINHPGGGDSAYAYYPWKKWAELPTLEKQYPEFSMWKELPSWGVFVLNASVVFYNPFELNCQRPDYRKKMIGPIRQELTDVDLENIWAKTIPRYRDNIKVIVK